MHDAPGRRAAPAHTTRWLCLLGVGVGLAATPCSAESVESEKPAAPVESAESADVERNASQTIDALHANLIDVMKHAVELGYEGRAKKLRPVIPEFFDIAFMARKSLGRHWKRADETEQQRFVDTFTRFMVGHWP